MNDNNISTTTADNGWLSNIEGYVRQYCELQQMQDDLSAVLQINSTEETATHMAVRLAAEREINGRMDYLSHTITGAVIERFKALAILSKYPELYVPITMESKVVSSISHASKTLLPMVLMFGIHILNSRLKIDSPCMT